MGTIILQSLFTCFVIRCLKSLEWGWAGLNLDWVDQTTTPIKKAKLLTLKECSAGNLIGLSHSNLGTLELLGNPTGAKNNIKHNSTP